MKEQELKTTLASKPVVYNHIMLSSLKYHRAIIVRER